MKIDGKTAVTLCFFFFQAEDGIRDVAVTGVQTCALPILLHVLTYLNPLAYGVDLLKHALLAPWTGAGYGGELRVALDVVALVGFAVVGLAGATPLLAREGGVTRAAFRERA